MTITGPFLLSRASTREDFTRIVACEYAAFTDPVLREIFMGPDTPAGHANLAAFYHKLSCTHPGDMWIKVEEKETGRIVAASNWRVYVGGVPETEEELGWEWLQGEENREKLERAKKYIQKIMDTRKRLFVGPYCRTFGFSCPFPLRVLRRSIVVMWITDSKTELHICFTDPEYQRRGIGSMMLKWGCDLADQLFLPAWVEASPEGNFLYRRFGFMDVEVNEGGKMQGSTMKREAWEEKRASEL